MKIVLGVVSPGRAMDFGPTKVEPMLDEGGCPRTGLGLLKTIRIACWTKIFHEELFACYGLVVK